MSRVQREEYASVAQNLEPSGLAVGSYYDVTLKADVTNVVDERNEGNNSKNLRISR